MRECGSVLLIFLYYSFEEYMVESLALSSVRKDYVVEERSPTGPGPEQVRTEYDAMRPAGAAAQRLRGERSDSLPSAFFNNSVITSGVRGIFVLLKLCCSIILFLKLVENITINLNCLSQDQLLQNLPTR